MLWPAPHFAKVEKTDVSRCLQSLERWCFLTLMWLVGCLVHSKLHPRNSQVWSQEESWNLASFIMTAGHLVLQTLCINFSSSAKSYPFSHPFLVSREIQIQDFPLLRENCREKNAQEKKDFVISTHVWAFSIQWFTDRPTLQTCCLTFLKSPYSIFWCSQLDIYVYQRKTMGRIFDRKSIYVFICSGSFIYLQRWTSVEHNLKPSCNHLVPHLQYCFPQCGHECTCWEWNCSLLQVLRRGISR